MEKGMKLKRCFVALDFPREIVNEIKAIQKMIEKKFIFTGKFTEEVNLHLTLKFLKEIDDNKIKEVNEILRRVRLNCFEAKLGVTGVFSKKLPKIVWVKINGVGELQENIDNCLRDLFKLENRFMGHVTIARIKYIKEKKEFVEYLKSIKGKSKFIVDKFSLKESELFPEGPVYKDLEVFYLEDN